MARVSLIDENNHADLAPLVERIRGRRRGALINVYRLLLNSPPLAATWFDHVNAVRWDTTLSGRLRELVIIRVGYLTSAAYILRQHVPRLALADGVSEAECADLADWQASDLFSEAERAALAYTDAMTRDIDVPDDVYDALARHFADERQIVELTVLIATYNMHSRVLQALKVDLEPLQG
jgi:alkylhydroperoxidase family enzyme